MTIEEHASLMHAVVQHEKHAPSKEVDRVHVFMKHERDLEPDRWR